MITNILVTALIAISTNWVTTEIIYTPCKNPGCLVYHMPTYKQAGIVSRDTFITWTNGVKVVVDSIPIETLQRIIPFEINNFFTEINGIELLKSTEKSYLAPTNKFSQITLELCNEAAKFNTQTNEINQIR
jgi:hypothetical protein